TSLPRRSSCTARGHCCAGMSCESCDVKASVWGGAVEEPLHTLGAFMSHALTPRARLKLARSVVECGDRRSAIRRRRSRHVAKSPTAELLQVGSGHLCRRRHGDRLPQAVLEAEDHQVNTVPRAELGKQPGHVRLDGGFT